MSSAVPQFMSKIMSKRALNAMLLGLAIWLVPLVAIDRNMEPVASAQAADVSTQYMDVAAGEQTRTVKIGLNKSMIVRLPVPARDVLASAPTVVDAVVRTARMVYLTGMADRADQRVLL